MDTLEKRRVFMVGVSSPGAGNGHWFDVVWITVSLAEVAMATSTIADLACRVLVSVS